MGSSAKPISFFGFPLEDPEDSWEDENYISFEDRYDEIEEIAKDYWCTVGFWGDCHYSDGTTMYLAGKEFDTYDWIHEIDVSDINPIAQDCFEHNLEKFCDKMGIPWQKPKWYLAASYG